MSNLELLKQGYKDFAAGNVDAVVALWQPDIVWNNCKGTPYVNEEGIYKGAKAIVEGVFAKIPEYFDGFKIEITEFIASGDKVVVVGHYSGIWKPTGKKFKANAIAAWTFKDGKVSHFFEAIDTAEIIIP